MNLALHEVTDGVFVSGWTCGHCPCPPQGTAKFFKHQNAMKALHHVLENPGQNIKLCKGDIPFQKKQQYNALDRQRRSKEKYEEIDKNQHSTLTAHFPAIPVPTAASLMHKGPPKEMNSSQSTILSSITSTPRRSPVLDMYCILLHIQ